MNPHYVAGVVVALLVVLIVVDLFRWRAAVRLRKEFEQHARRRESVLKAWEDIKAADPQGAANAVISDDDYEAVVSNMSRWMLAVFGVSPIEQCNRAADTGVWPTRSELLAEKQAEKDESCETST